MHLKRFFGCNVLKSTTKSHYSIVSFRISVALLIFCLEDLSIDVSGVLNSPTIIVFPPISPCMSVLIHRCLCAPRGCRGRVVPAVSTSRMRQALPSLRGFTLPMRLQWQTLAPSCANPRLWLRPHSIPFRLFLHSQPQASPHVCPLKPKFQPPAPMHTSRHVSQAGECSKMSRICSVQVSLCSVCPKLAAALSSEPLKLPFCHG